MATHTGTSELRPTDPERIALIKRIVDQAPPLSAETRAALRVLLRPVVAR